MHNTSIVNYTIRCINKTVPHKQNRSINMIKIMLMVSED